MGIFNNIAQVVMTFKADTRDLEAGLKKVEGAEKAALKSTLDTTKARNDGIASWAKGLGDVNQGLELATKAIGIAADAWKEYEANAKKVGGAQLERAKEFRSALDQMNEAWRQGKLAIGEFVVAMGPALQALADAASMLAQISSMSGGGMWSWNSAKTRVGLGAITNVLSPGGIDLTGGVNPYASGGAVLDDAERVRRQIAGNHGSWGWDGKSPKPGAWGKPGKEKKPGGGGGGYDLFANGGGETSWGTAPGGVSQEWLDEQFAKKMADYQFAHQFDNFGQGVGQGHLYNYDVAGAEGLAKKAAGIGDQIRMERKQTLLENIFGPIEDFNAYQKAFSGLTDAVTSGYEAMVTGSMSFGQAVKQSIAQSLLAAGKEASVHAITELAYGLGSLAIGGPLGGASAAHHFAAAAMFGAAAAAAGVASHALGTGGGASAGSGAPGAYVGSGNSGDRGGSVQNIYIGDGMGQNSPRFERQRAIRSAKIARRETSDSDSVRWG